MDILSQLAIPKNYNAMVNYTFYQRETAVMVVSSIASACLVLIGVISNALALQVLNTKALERTSFQIYFKWVCCYHLVSLMLTCIRQQTFLLDVGTMEHEINTQRRFNRCLGLLFGIIELEHFTVAGLILLLWNRIWAQRTKDHATCLISAMRNPILLNVSAFLLALIPTSSYISNFRRDAIEYNMTMCSYSFIHAYGSPGLQWPNLIYRVAAVEELVLVVSFLVLLVEIVNRIIRQRKAVDIKDASLTASSETTPGDSPSVTSNTDIGKRATFPKIRLRESRNLSSSTSILPELDKMASCIEDQWDMSMSSMTVVYISFYFLMGMPSRILDYFCLFDIDDFPFLISLSLLRQALQAGTVFFMCVGSAHVRQTILELASPSSDVSYTSSTALLDPVSTRKYLNVRAARQSRYLHTALSGDHSTAEIRGHRRATLAPEPAYDSRAATESPTRSAQMDRLELGLNTSEVSRRQTIVLINSRKSQSHITMDKLEDGSTRPSITCSGAESDV